MAQQLTKVLLGLILVGVATHSLANPGNGGGSGGGFTGDFPVVSGKGVLIVTGNGYHHRELYEDGEVPTLTALDDSGDLLPEGIYRFQFTSMPGGGSRGARQRDLLSGDAFRSGGNGSSTASYLSGTFEVVGGHLIYR